MSEPFARLRRFLRELKRRKVYRVAVTYAVVAAGAVQLVSVVIPASRLPAWSDEFFLGLAVFGFPIAVVLAWAFEVTPEGVRRTEAVDGAGSEVGAYQWIGLAVVVLLAGGVWYATTGDGGEPAPETTATADTSATRPASTARDTAGPPRIAVLPFENIAPDSAEDYFARGMHEEVLNQLSKVSGLAVLSRTTMMEMADAGMTASEIGRKLDADAILEGTVRRAGDRVRITTQLIETPADEHLWSNTYERALSVEEIFDIQADIAEQIAGALETQMAEGERERIEDAPTEDLAAYEAFLRGRGQVRQFWVEFTPELLDRASRNLQEAIRRDSSFAEAYASLSGVYLGRIWNRPAAEASRWLDSAAATVEQARRIDPDLAAVYRAQADIYEFQDSLDAQAKALRRVLELQPSHAGAMNDLAQNLARRGRFGEAVRAAREAVRLDPRRPAVLGGMGDRLQAVGLYDPAETWFRHLLEIEPGSALAYLGLVTNELEQGRPERALALWEDYLKQTPSPPSFSIFFATLTALAADRPEQAQQYIRKDPDYPATERDFSVGSTPSPERGTLGPAAALHLGFSELGVGHEERGRRLVAEAVEALKGETHRGERLGRPYGVFLAGGLAVLGRTEEALQEVERVVEEGPGRATLLWYPLLDSLRSGSRFQAILQELEAKRDAAREEIRRMDLDLYPPGAEPDTATEKTQTDD